MADPIKSALDVAKAKIDQLLSERSEIDKEIVDWKKVADSLSAVSGEVSADLPPDVDLTNSLAPALTLKFTDAIRWILKSYGPLSAPRVRDELIQLGFDFSKYKQELVPIHNTLKRLEEQGEVQAIRNDPGTTVVYKWIDPVAKALAENNADQLSMSAYGPWAEAIKLATTASIAASAQVLPKRKTLLERIAERPTRATATDELRKRGMRDALLRTKPEKSK